MGQAGVLGLGPTAEITANTNPSYREAYIQEARRKGAGRMERKRHSGDLQGREMPPV